MVLIGSTDDFKSFIKLFYQSVYILDGVILHRLISRI